MSERRLTTETMRYISLFEQKTGASVKDCLLDEQSIVFVVELGQVGMAVGKEGKHVKELRTLLGKDIKVIEYSNDVEHFIRNIFHQFNVEIHLQEGEEGKRAVVIADPQEKGKVIGKGGRNIKLARTLVARHYNLDGLKIA